MERTEVLDMMSGLKLYGMRSAYDETLAAAIKRKHEPQRFVGDLLKAERADASSPPSRPATTVGASRTAPERHELELHLTALDPAAQPRPAPPGRALPFAAITTAGSLLDADLERAPWGGHSG
jgi:hypothetical protein